MKAEAGLCERTSTVETPASLKDPTKGMTEKVCGSERGPGDPHGPKVSGAAGWAAGVRRPGVPTVVQDEANALQPQGG